MRADLKLGHDHDGFLFLAEARRGAPMLRSHHHDELELNLVVQGDITYVIDGRRVSLGPRSLLWLFPRQEHQLVDRTDDARYFVAVFTPAMIRRHCTTPASAGLLRQDADPHEILHSRLPPASYDLLRRQMAALAAEGPDPDLLNREGGYGAYSGYRYRHEDPDLLNAGLHHLLVACWRHHQRGTADDAGVALSSPVAQALDRLHRGAEDLSLAELARRCGTSPSHLSRRFHAELGVPLTQYRASLRLERFWEVWRSGTHPTLLAAALAAGFGSYAQFHRVFTAAHGEGPRKLMG